MPVFNTAANTWRMPSYLEEQQQIAQTELLGAQTAGVEKDTEQADDQLLIAQAKSQRDLEDSLRKGTEEQREAHRNGSAAGLAYREENPGDDEGMLQAYEHGYGKNLRRDLGLKEGDALPEGWSDGLPTLMEATDNSDFDVRQQRISTQLAKDPKWQNLGTADGEILVTAAEGTPEYEDALDQGMNLIGPANQTQNVNTRDMTLEAAQEMIAERGKVASDILDSLRGIVSVPGAGGMGGWLTENLGGLAGSLPGQVGVGMERIIAETFSGASPEAVAAVRSTAQTDLPTFLRLITGDTSRFSDKDVELAKSAQKAVSPTASHIQIVAAYSNMARIAMRDTFRAMHMAKKDLPFTFDGSPTDTSNIALFIGTLRKDGMTQEIVKELLVDIESLTNGTWVDRIGLPSVDAP